MAKWSWGTNKVRFRVEWMGEGVDESEIWLRVKSITSWKNWKILQCPVCQQHPFANLIVILRYKHSKLNPLLGQIEHIHWPHGIVYSTDLQFFLVKGITEPYQYYIRCKEVSPDPSPGILISSTHCSSPFLCWKKQPAIITVHWLSALHSQYCRPLHSAFSFLLFRKKNTNLLSFPFYKS